MKWYWYTLIAVAVIALAGVIVWNTLFGNDEETPAATPTISRTIHLADSSAVTLQVKPDSVALFEMAISKAVKDSARLIRPFYTDSLSARIVRLDPLGKADLAKVATVAKADSAVKTTATGQTPSPSFLWGVWPGTLWLYPILLLVTLIILIWGVRKKKPVALAPAVGSFGVFLLEEFHLISPASIWLYLIVAVGITALAAGGQWVWRWFKRPRALKIPAARPTPPTVTTGGGTMAAPVISVPTSLPEWEPETFAGLSPAATRSGPKAQKEGIGVLRVLQISFAVLFFIVAVATGKNWLQSWGLFWLVLLLLAVISLARVFPKNKILRIIFLIFFGGIFSVLILWWFLQFC